LLGVDPGFVLAEGVSPRIVALLDEVKATTIGTVELTTDPGDVTVLVDGAPGVVVNGRVPLAGGAHTLVVSRPGYREVEQPVVVSAGQSVPLRLVLERVSTVLTVVTSPPDVEVVVNGKPKGKTLSGPLAPSLAGLPAQLKVAPDQLSQPLPIAGLATGTLDIELRRPCYASEHRQLTVEGLSDVMLDPVVLKPAVGSVSIDSEPTGATVWFDGESKGTAPLTLPSVCAGEHMVEFRGAAGRAVERLTLEAGASLAVRGRVRPAFALLPAPPAGQTTDPRLMVEKAFSAAQSVLLYAPPADQSRTAVEHDPVNDEWFGLAPGQTDLPPGDRRARLQHLVDAFESQGIAWVKPTAPGSSEVQLAIEVPGAARPDVLTVELDQASSLSQVMNRLDAPLVLSSASLGVTSVDVLDVNGAVILGVEATLPGAQAGLKPGEIIETLDGQTVTSVSDFETRLAGHQLTDRVNLGVRGADGATRMVTAGLQRMPVLAAGTDRFMPANAMVAILRSRLAAASDAADRPALELNLGAALLRSGDAAGAQDVLEKASLPAGPGVSKGTLDFLRGEAAERAGDKAAALRSYTAASQADGRLSQDGPLVKDLAARALERLK
jgi:PEGA domain/PDZ domain